MIVIVALLLGAVVGGAMAHKRGGKPLDVAQWATVYAIIFALLGLFVTILIGRLA